MWEIHDRLLLLRLMVRLDNAIKPQRLEPLQFSTKDRTDSNPVTA
jgi:hypothetical protein